MSHLINVQEAEQRVIDMALAWWRGRRHVRDDLTKHLQNPTINTFGFREPELARAVADLILLEKKNAEELLRRRGERSRPPLRATTLSTL